MKRANAGTTEKRVPVAGVEIPITDIGPLMIGQTEDKESGTGSQAAAPMGWERRDLLLRRPTTGTGTSEPDAVRLSERSPEWSMP